MESRHAARHAAEKAVAQLRESARELLTRAGFDVLRTDFLFLFPRVLSALRPLEGSLARFPAGAQYMVLCRKGKW